MRSLRLALVAASAAAVLVVAGPTAAAPTATVASSETGLFVDAAGLGSDSIAAIGFTFPTRDEPPAESTTLFVPQRFDVDVSATPGTEVGKALVYLRDNAANGGASVLPLDLAVADPAAVAADAEAQACAPGPHAAVWIGRGSVLAQPVVLALFVDPAGSTDPAPAGFRITFCPPAAARATAGQPPAVSVVSLFVLLDTITVPEQAANYIWRAVVTPYLPGSWTADPDHAYELRAELPIPRELAVRGTYDAARHTAVLTGTLTAAGRPWAAARISVAADTSPDELASTRTDKQGNFTLRVPMRETTAYDVSVDAAATSCPAPAAAPGGCLSDNVTPPDDQEVRVRLPETTDPKRALRAADQQLAHRIDLGAADFPAGWASTRTQTPFDNCGDFAPDLSDLTVTGEDASPVFFNEKAATAALSTTTVLLTSDQAQAWFDRVPARVGVPCLRSLSDSDAKVVSAAPLRFPKLGRGTRAFRGVFAVQEDSGAPPERFTADIVYLLGKRSVTTLYFLSGAKPFVFERKVVTAVAARAARG